MNFIKKPMQTICMMQNIYKTKQRPKTLFVIFLIFLALTITFGVIVSIASFSDTKNAGGSVQLGGIDFCVVLNGNANKTLLPGDKINASVVLLNSKDANGQNYQNLCPILVRYSVDVYADNVLDNNLKQCLNFLATDDFTRSGDMFYCNLVIDKGQKVNIFGGAQVQTNLPNSYQNKAVSFVFNIDAVQAGYGAESELWPNAPSQWKQQIKNQPNYIN